MLSIFICEDEVVQRENIENHVRNQMMMEAYEMEIVMSTDSPGDILEYLEEHPETVGLYFLDIELKCELNGIQLAARIREMDTQGSIVFITTHSEMAMTTFKYKVAALEFILKDTPEDIKHQLSECMKIANRRYTNSRVKNQKQIKLRVGNQIKVVNLEDIYYIETSDTPHRLVLHTANSLLEFYGTLKEILPQLNELSHHFVQVHQSYVVNNFAVDVIDRKKREIIFINGDKCIASFSGIKKIINKRKSDE